ncbi:chemotaxis protein CheW [Halomonas organivorans]|uniref:Chemotaxis protein CheA n=1 Tax=Halomonas organivorans TaxID=257772 RepID=A0A7W5BY81_9GAMM|nr:chemotaxis protein CheW [Halomonas organivorans]MBB3140398.1 two-component system chemotaxis sensor kinase CheA [Halomonas organivorans]
MDITDFYDTFFEEAEELLADMERYLLELDVDDPDAEQLNAIFRAAHSIKGGAGTFGFDVLQQTTHLFENLLDHTRQGELTLRRDIVDTFLETKDMLHDQLDAYRNDEEPDQEAFARICETLQRLALEEIGQALDGANGVPGQSSVDTPAASAPEPAPTPGEASPGEASPGEPASGGGGEKRLTVSLLNVGDKDRGLLVEELEQLGEIEAREGDSACYRVTLTTAVGAEDIEAVMCFIVEPEQLRIEQGDAEASSAGAGEPRLTVSLINVGDKDRGLLVEELEQLGEIEAREGDASCYRVTLATAVSAEDIEAVMGFIVEPDQLRIEPAGAPGSDAPAAGEAPAPDADEPVPENVAEPVAAPAADAKAETPKPAADKPKQDKPKQDKPKARKAKSGGGESTSIRVSVEKVDQIINLVGELIITQSMLDQTVSELDNVNHSGLHNGMNLLQRNARDLQEAVMSVRMIPMDFVFSRFPRVVRETAGKLGKEIELVTEGESTELDKSLTERIIDPLTHLVRNSLDHGIEAPDAREAAGKPRTGKLTLSAKHQGGNILIEVIDDGGGLNRERILAKARENGLNVSDGMSDDEVWQMIFAPGFSTAQEVSDVSGRGVGMDVVKRNIQGMGGNVQIMSRPGEGTTIRIVLPLTLAILDGMSIKVGREVFILPLSAVLESLQPSRDDLYAMAGDDVVLKVRDEYLPVVPVHEALDVTDAKTELDEMIAVIVQGEGRRYALLVDELIGQQQVVVKNLETNYRKVPGVSAATILGDGSVALILDITDLHRLNRAKKEARRGQRVDAAPTTLSRKEVEPS